MDPLTFGTLAASAVGFLVPVFKSFGEKALDKAAEKSGEALAENPSKVMEIIKNLFLEDDLTTLGDLSRNPDDAKLQGKIEGKLEEKLKANPEAARELEELLKKLPVSQINQNMIDIRGDGNTAVQDVSGTVTINR